MKGIIFTEFLDLVENKFGLEMVDKIISQSNLKSGGAYTSIGYYSFSEMLQLLQNLSKNTAIAIDDILLLYGEYFFGTIVNDYADILSTYNDPVEMLVSAEKHIYVEVKKIYLDAELPSFKVKERKENSLIMIYRSSNPMHYFVLGLINKTFEYFNTAVNVVFEKN
jgi:hypothetical protein